MLLAASARTLEPVSVGLRRERQRDAAGAVLAGAVGVLAIAGDEPEASAPLAAADVVGPAADRTGMAAAEPLEGQDVTVRRGPLGGDGVAHLFRGRRRSKIAHDVLVSFRSPRSSNSGTSFSGCFVKLKSLRTSVPAVQGLVPWLVRIRDRDRPHSAFHAARSVSRGLWRPSPCG